MSDAVSTNTAAALFDNRGGIFFELDGARIHEADLTARQRKRLASSTLPAVPSAVPATAPSSSDVTTDAT